MPSWFHQTIVINQSLRFIICPELHRDNRDLHRFVQAAPGGEGVIDMRMTRVTFGVTSSPFLATQVLSQVAKEEFPRAAKIIFNFYVDDCLTGAATHI